MRKKLLVLLRSDNPRHLSLCLADDPIVVKCGVIINEQSGNWTAPNTIDPARPREKYAIGEARLNCKSGAIGVYNRYNLQHLKDMVAATSEASRGNGHLF